MGQKKIKYILENPNETESGFSFYLIACSSYDEYLHVYKSDDINFHIMINRKIQPDIITVFNAILDGNSLRILSLIEDEFVVDEIQNINTKSDQNFSCDIER